MTGLSDVTEPRRPGCCDAGDAMIAWQPAGPDGPDTYGWAIDVNSTLHGPAYDRIRYCPYCGTAFDIRDTRVQVHPAVAVLNRAFAADPAAVRAMVINHVPCNMALAEDPTVVVDIAPHIGGPPDDGPEGRTTVGALGLINGILAEQGLPLVAGRWGDPGDDRTTRRFLGFCIYRPPAGGGDVSC